MRIARASLLVLAALSCGAGCASLLGADFDRPGASDDGGAAEDASNNVVDVDGGTDARANADASSRLCDGGPCKGTWTVQGDQDILTFAMQVWGTGPKDLYVIAAGGTSYMWTSTGDGTWDIGIATDPDHPHRAMWGTGPNDMYLAGDGTMLHIGSQLYWLDEDAGPQQHFTIWGSGPNDVYAGGSNHSMLHSPGDGTWTAQTTGLSAATTIEKIWGSGPNDVYAISLFDLYHSTGNGTWTKVFTAPSRINDIWGTGKDDVYLVGEKDGIYHRGADGKWTPQPSGMTTTMFSAVWGSGAGDVYVGGQNGVILHGTGNGKWLPDTDQLNEDIVGIWGSSGQDVYAITMRSADARGSILHRKPPQ
jgi:hypothetical protein